MCKLTYCGTNTNKYQFSFHSIQKYNVFIAMCWKWTLSMETQLKQIAHKMERHEIDRIRW